MRRKFFIRDGAKVAVIRPEDPDMAIRHANILGARNESGIISDEEFQRLFNEMLNEQPYRYIGLLGEGGKLLDEKGWAIGKVKPGDSFVPFDQVHAGAR